MTGSLPASAALGDGELTVEVNRDYSGDGVYDPAQDPPQAGVDVTVTDGVTTLGPVATNAAGQAVFDLETLAGSRFRVDVEITDPALDHLQAAPAAPATTANAFRSFTTFVDGGSQTIHVGVWNPATYVPLNPPLAVIQQIDRDGDPSTRSIAVTTWDNRGPENSDAGSNFDGLTTVATQAETGTVFGSAWDYRTEQLYTAAYAKSHTLYGPGGNGAIYRTDTAAAAPGNTAVWAVVPDAGSSVHQTEPNHDDPFFLANGREGLGGLALSDDGTTLYAVNLNDRSLYSFATAAAAMTPAIDSVTIGDPGCVGGEWRPFAVTVRDGAVYVGGVCDASTSLDRADLVAHVLRLDGGSFTSVFSQTLDFARGGNDYSDPAANQTGPNVATHWNPWRTSWGADLDEYLSRAPLYPTPMLTAIEFENDGSLILGFRDRTSDATVKSGYAPDDLGQPEATLLSNQIVGGDINKVCLTDGVYEWEGTGSCPNNHTVDNSGGEPADRVEFFTGEFLDSTFAYGPTSGVHHYENSMGGLAFSPREADVANTTMDPTGLYNTGGIGFYDRESGAGPGNDPWGRGLVVAGSEAFNFGKANGLGDLELLAAEAPIQIGNLVWFDADVDGEQDAAADEPAIPGVTVRLLSTDGTTVLATTTTDENGEYYFGGEGGYPLEPGAAYVVEFDASGIDPATLPGSPTLDHLTYTRVQEPSAGPVHDSNPTPVPANNLVARATVTAPSEPGGVDHTIDAGLAAARVDIEKGDSGSATPGPIVNDADTSATGQGYADGETRAITFDVRNTGALDLYDVTVTDDTLGGDVTVEALACVFPGQSAPGTAAVLTGTTWTVHWAATFGDATPPAVAWEPGVAFGCTATLTLAGGDAPHMDRASVLTNLAPLGSPGNAPQDGPSDQDDYHAFTGAIQVIKYDGNLADPAVGSGPAAWTPPVKPLVDAAQDANTPAEAVVYPADAAQPVRWVVTNTGQTWLTGITLADTTSDGPDIGAWTCDLAPVGGPSGYSFSTSGAWAGPLAPGASFFCEGPLTLPVDDTHGDTVEVTGTVVVPVLDGDGQPVLDNDGVPTYQTDVDGGPVASAIVVTDDDPFHAETPPAPPATTTTSTTTTTTPPGPGPVPPTNPAAPPAPGTLPATGGSGTNVVLVWAMFLLAGGAGLAAVTRRRTRRV